MSDEGVNYTELSFEVVEREPLRFTPAKVPVLRGIGRHASSQWENGEKRSVAFRFRWVAVGMTAERLSHLPLGAQAIGIGFWAARKLEGMVWELHLSRVEIVAKEGMKE
ncbi:MAG: hypothetical protein N2557_07310 [Hydrogenophilus sp.]|nr:hypothetical protein [Hydrogenophilus sp.]